MSVIFATLVFLITEYSLSESRFPAAMLSVTHSGRTTCAVFFALDVKCLCVLAPFSCCDVRMCVAPDAVRLLADVSRDTILEKNEDVLYLATRQHHNALHLNVRRIFQISVDVHSDIT